MVDKSGHDLGDHHHLPIALALRTSGKDMVALNKKEPKLRKEPKPFCLYFLSFHTSENRHNTVIIVSSPEPRHSF